MKSTVNVCAGWATHLGLEARLQQRYRIAEQGGRPLEKDQKRNEWRGNSYLSEYYYVFRTASAAVADTHIRIVRDGSSLLGREFRG